MYVIRDPTSRELKKVMYVTQNMANTKLHIKDAKFVDGGIGGMMSNLLISELMLLERIWIFSSMGIEKLKNFCSVMFVLKMVCSGSGAAVEVN